MPLILKLSFIRRPLYHWGIPGTYRGGDWIGHTARLDAFGKKNTLPVPRNEQHLLGSEPWNRSHCATYPIRALPSSTVILFLYSSYIYIYIYIYLFIYFYIYRFRNRPPLVLYPDPHEYSRHPPSGSRLTLRRLMSYIYIWSTHS